MVLRICRQEKPRYPWYVLEGVYSHAVYSWKLRCTWRWPSCTLVLSLLGFWFTCAKLKGTPAMLCSLSLLLSDFSANDRWLCSVAAKSYSFITWWLCLSFSKFSLLRSEQLNFTTKTSLVIPAGGISFTIFFNCMSLCHCVKSVQSL